MDVSKAVVAFFRNARDVVGGFEFSLARPPRETETQYALTTSANWDASAGLITASQPASTDFKADQTLGQLLTETRERAGISRERVAEEIRIPPHYMRMIESGIYDAIPDELYLVPFIRRYAAFLGLDPQKVVSRFIQDFEKAENAIVVETSVSAKDARTLRISLLGSAALFAVVVLLYIGSRIGTLPATVTHPATAPSMTETQDKEGASGSSAHLSLETRIDGRFCYYQSAAPSGARCSGRIDAHRHARDQSASSSETHATRSRPSAQSPPKTTSSAVT